MANNNLRDIRSNANFMQGAQKLLIQTIESFFSANVRLHFEPMRELPVNYGVDILSCPRRYVYILNDDRVLIVPRLRDMNGDMYYLAIAIDGYAIGCYNKRNVYDKLASTI